MLKNMIKSPKAYLPIILLFTLLTYANIFQNGFCIDDHAFIVDWPLIQDFGNFPQFFGSENQPKGEEGVYSPLKTCFHAINYHLWGSNPLGYHLVALLIHLIGVIFVYRISFLLASNTAIAFLSGLLFGLHPVHVEAITSATGSVDTSGVVFLFVSFYFYIKARQNDFHHYRSYVVSLFFALLAIFTHELTIMLPFLFLLYELCYGKGKYSFRTCLLKIAPYFGFVAIYVFCKAFILGGVTRGGYLYDSFYLTLLVIVKALAKYVLICFFPFRLAINHEISPGIFSVDWRDFDQKAVLSQSILNFQVLMSIFITGAIIYIAVRMWKKNPIVTFCIGWFYISLLPVLNIVPSGSYFAERYLYPGTLGFCLLGAYMLFYMFHYKGPRFKQFLKWSSICITIGAIIFYSGRTVIRNGDWKNYLTFLKAEVRMNPRHPITQKDLSVAYLENNQPLKALEHIEQALYLKPDGADIHFVSGEVYRALGDDAKAAASFLVAIQFDPEFADAYYSVAETYMHSGKKQKARSYLQASIRLYREQEKQQEAEIAEGVLNRYF